MDISAKFLFTKRLTPSDVSRQSKLIIRSADFKRGVQRRWLRDEPHEAIEEGIALAVYDREVGSVIAEKFVLKLQSGKKYVFQKDWRKFARRKGLQAGHTVKFWWNLFLKRLEIQCIQP